MRIRRLRLVNFGKYLDKTVNFAPGVNAVVGPVGSGKSTILEAVPFALTGGNGLHGPKTANARADAEEDEESYVELDFVHDGKEALLKRLVRPTGVFLSLGGKNYRSHADVKDALEALFQRPLEAVIEHAFVSQWEVFGFLVRPPAERAKLLGRLFGLQKFARVRDALAGLETDLLVPGCAAELSLAKKALEGARDNAENLGDLLTASGGPPGPQPNTTADRALLERIARARAGLKELDAREQELDRLTEGLLTARERRELLAAQLAARRPKVELDRDIEDLQSALGLASRAREEAVRRQACKAQLEALKVRAAALTEPVPPEPYVRASSPVGERLESLRGRKLGLLHMLDGETCPVCNGPPLPLDVVEGYRDANDADIAEIETSWSASRRYDQLLEKYEIDKVRLQAEVERTAVLVPAHGEEPPTSEDLRAAAALSQDLRRQRDELAALALKLAAEDQAERSLLIGIDGAKKIVDRLSSEVMDDETDEEEVRRIGERIEAIEAGWAARVRLAADLRAAESSALDLAVRVERLALADKEAAIAAVARAKASRAKDVFHHSAAPGDLAAACLKALLAETDEVLAGFNAGFTVVSDGLELCAIMADGARIAAERLSGGQKVLFALAFRFVAAALFAGDIGFLSLDEPTAGLDAAGVARFGQALEHLRRMAGSAELQVLIVTHERELVSLFDHAYGLE